MKISFYILITCILLSACNLISPVLPDPKSTIFVKLFGGSENTVGVDILEHTQGHAILLGTTILRDSTRNQIILIEVDSFGNEGWTKTLVNKKSLRAIAIDKSSSNHLLVLGELEGKPYFALLDENGVLSKESIYNVDSFFYDTPAAFCQTSDGGFAIVLQSDFSDIRLIKVDAQLNMEWQELLGSSSENERPVDVAQLANDDFLITYTKNEFSANPEIAVLITTSDGRLKFVNTIGEGRPDDFIVNTDNSIMLLSHLDTSICLTKINPDFVTVAWTKCYGGGGSQYFYNETRNRVSRTSSGFIIFGEQIDNEASKKLKAIYTDSEGNKQWSQEYGTNKFFNQAGGIMAYPQGGYLAIGTNDFGNLQNMVLLKMNSQGTLDETIE